MRRNSPIPIPPKSQKRLGDLLAAFQSFNAQIDGVVVTLRELLDVPDDYVLNDVQIGFEPPPGQPAEALAAELASATPPSMQSEDLSR